MLRTFLFCLTILFFQSFSIAQSLNEVPPPPPVDTLDRIFSKVEFEAEFPGGVSEWRTYLQKNLKADVPVKKGAPVGSYKVIVRFIVSKDGTISEITPETNFGYGMEDEVIRVIKKGPKWNPALQNGRKVNAYRRQPITFIVSDK